MKLVRLFLLIARHKMTPLIAALWASIVALAHSAEATYTAFETSRFAFDGYWTVTAAVLTVTFALMAAVRGKADADAEPPLGHRIKAILFA